MSDKKDRSSQVIIKTIVLLLFIGLILTGKQSVLADEGGGWISYGEMISGVIDSGNYTDHWHFYGNEGDVITAVASATSSAGNLDTFIDFWYKGSDWEWLTSDDDSGGGDNGTDAALYSYYLPYDGEYVVSVSRFDKEDGDTSGVYYLMLELSSSSSSTDSNSGQGSQRNLYTPDDIWEPSHISESCPAGGFCLKADTFKWSFNNLDYCVADNTGTWVTANGHGFYIYGGTVTSANLLTMTREAVAYWEGTTAFDFRETTNCGAAEIVIGWGQIGDMQAVSNDNSVHPLGFAISINQSPKQFLIVMNMDDFSWDRSSSNNNFDAANTLAHEIGHTMGIGHDEFHGTLMYPSNPSQTRLSSNGLGTDTENQLADMYPSWVAWSNTRRGVNMQVFETTSSNASSVSVAYPEGASNLLALCAVHGYFPLGNDPDPDAGWSCNWQWDQNNQAAHFTLTPSNMNQSGGSLLATAIVLDTDLFMVPANYYFVAESEGSFGGHIKIHPTTYYDQIYGGEFGELDVSWISDDAIPVVTITEYYSSGDDDFSYWVDVNMNNDYVDAYGWEGNENSYVAGFITFIQPADNDRRVASCFVGGENDISHTYEFPAGACTTSFLEQNWNTAAFPSLIGYSTNENDYYAAWLNLDLVNRGNGGIGLNGHMQIQQGDNDSYASYEVVIFQSK